MRIGLDFDNTIVCYDAVFHAAARRWGLVPDDLAATKTAVQAHLIGTGRENVWTELQGYVYGEAIAEAEPFPGLTEFLQACRREGHWTAVISHKTRAPLAGTPRDLHGAAHAWLARHGWFPSHQIWFEETLAAKVARIGACGCDLFIDDLTSVLQHPAFPARTRGVLFDPPGGVDWTRLRETL